jgi:hypothetical protein
LPRPRRRARRRRPRGEGACCLHLPCLAPLSCQS